MRTKILLLFICICTLSSFQENEIKLPLYLNDYKTEVTEGMFINCLTIKDLAVVMPLKAQMKTYDLFKLELHRFGEETDIIAAYKTFDPKSKEFLKKHDVKETLKLKILAEENNFNGSDLETNTTIFPAYSTTNSVFCQSHDTKNCSFYLIIKGYKKTGEKTRFDEDVYDKGTDLSAKSVVFKSWIDRTKK